MSAAGRAEGSPPAPATRAAVPVQSERCDTRRARENQGLAGPSSGGRVWGARPCGHFHKEAGVAVGLKISCPYRRLPIPGFLKEAGLGALSLKCEFLALMILIKVVSNGAPTEAGFLSGCGMEGPHRVSPERGERAERAGDKERKGEGKRRRAPWQRSSPVGSEKRSQAGRNQDPQHRRACVLGTAGVIRAERSHSRESERPRVGRSGPLRGIPL